ncbi:MAG: peptidylprolyl isomerase [Firmicutes bacterium]|nr:peptidylprolyl isomerase [Bacillota bacterium]
MSASTEKKNRQAAREAGTDKKTLAAQAEAKKKARSKLRWTLGTIGVVILIAAILFLNSSFLYTGTTALTIGGEGFSPARVSYSYANQYYTWANQYGSYASLFGLDTSAGIAGLGSQSCPMLEGGTWRDYFLDAASQELTQTKALLDYAAEKSITLDEDEIAQVDAGFEGLDEYVKGLGYGSVDKFFAASYGTGVTKALVRQAGLDSALASKVLTQMSDSFQYTEAELEEYYKGLEGASDIFGLAYYYVAAETVETTAEDGTASSAPTEETLAAAKATADAILAAYESGFAPAGPVTGDEPVTGEAAGEDETVTGEAAAEDETVTGEAAAEDKAAEPLRFGDAAMDAAADRFDEAVASQVDGARSTRSSTTKGSSLGAYKDWMTGSRQLGDAAVIENDGSGYYVVLFLSRDDNHYPLAQVRHILVKAEADESGAYTEEAKAAAREKAEEIYAQWQAGDKTEDSFAALANEMSEDAGSNTRGGLYDAVAKNQMVKEFDAFCFEGHKPGDTAIVYGETSSYAGYHIMYYVGEGQLYSDYIAESAMRSEALQAWLTELSSGYEAVTGFGYRLVG